MADNSEKQPPLLRLPTEIFQHMAECADRRSLKALRLTCRDTAAKVLKIYARELFSHPAFFMQCLMDLKLALRIVEHPVYGPAIRKITWMVEEVSRPSKFQADIPEREMEDQAHVQLETQWKAWEVQEKMRIAEEDQSLLTTIFLRLKEHRKLEHVAISDIHSSGPKPVNLLEETDQTAGTELDSPAPTDLQPFKLIVNALHAADMDLDSFQISVEEWCFPIHLISTEPTLLANTLSLVQNLTRLELRLWCDSISDNNVKDILVPLSSAPRLKDLDVQVFDSDALRAYDINAYHFAGLFMQENYRALETLALAGVFFHIRDFFEFIMKHKRLALKRLDLNTLSIIDWEGFISSSREKPEDSKETTLRKLIDLPGTWTHVDFGDL